MRPLSRRALTVGCIGSLLVAGAVGGWSLHTPDPRTRAGWDPAPLTLPADHATAVDLYLPSCDVSGVRIRAASGSGGEVVATVGGRTTRLTLDGSDSAILPLPEAPGRMRVTATLTPVAAPITLAAPRPFALVVDAGAEPWLLPCGLGIGTPTFWAWSAVLALHLVGLGWLAARVAAPQPSAGGAADAGRARSSAMAAALVTTTVALYAALVPPFEPPDELAHLQYARYVATTGRLPHAVPAANSEWRASAYEWVQQPGYYVAAAALLRASGLAEAQPLPEVHPQSRLAGGPDVNIYRHPDTASPAAAGHGLWWLRGLSVCLAALTIWGAAHAVRLTTGDVRLALYAAGAVALVPQWAAVMGSVSTDPPATCAAALATWGICRMLTGADAGWRPPLAIGLVTGAAYAIKVTTVFLLPMMVVALLAVGLRRGTAAAVRDGLIYGIGVALTAAWIPVRAWIVFGDPLARAFKRDVLAIGGFVVQDGPPLFSVAFLDDLRRMVFEAFWARFGSLGAGPLPGTRLWSIYAAATAVLIGLLLVGQWRALTGLVRGWRRRAPVTGETSALFACAIGVAVGLALWAWINLVPQADVVVHWTPRHILPLTAPLLVVTAAGLQLLVRRLPNGLRPALRLSAAAGVLVLAITGLAVMRSVVLGFYFGF